MTNQEDYWKGLGGKAYLKRNAPDNFSSFKFFERVIWEPIGGKIRSALEFGANDGRNLTALKSLGVSYVSGVEVNSEAYEELMMVTDSSFNQSLLDFKSDRQWDLVFTKGCLIHIHPDDILKALKVIYECAYRYILIAEYHSPQIETVIYRGRRDLLWKGPYAEMILEENPNLKLKDYGFVSKLDPVLKEDDLTWFLLQK